VVQTAEQMVYGAALAAADLDRKAIAVRTNTIKYPAAEATYKASNAAVQTHGGFGAAHDYDIEQLFRKARSARVALVTQELALNYAAETALDLPRSY